MTGPSAPAAGPPAPRTRLPPQGGNRSSTFPAGSPAWIAVPDRGAGLQVVGGVAGGRVGAVHAQGDPAHAGEQERLAVGPHPVGMTVGEGGPDLPRQDLPDQPAGVGRGLHRAPAAPAASSGKLTQARRRNDASNALMVSCTSAPWAKSPWPARLPSSISVTKSLTRLE